MKDKDVINMCSENASGDKIKTVDSGHRNRICNENYHFLFEQATDAILVTDFNGNFKNANSCLCSMFGYTREELLELNVRTLLDEEHVKAVSYTHLRAHETPEHLVCRL